MQQDLVTEIKQRINIVNVIGRYVSVKKTGSNYKALCPFHSENTPSFVISEEMQFFKCFGCGKSGDVITFTMEMEGIEFKDAIKQLAEEAQIDITQYKFSDKSENTNIYYEINLRAQEFYSYTLLNLEIGKTAKKYLTERGLTTEHIKEFKLGYAPNSWESLYNFLSKKYKAEDIEKTGLIKNNNKKYYDVYRGRIMFPLENQGGKIVGFAGRTIINEDPKYINTKETPIFNKSEFVFNLNKAKTEVKRKNEVIVTEGEFDAITPYIKGIKNIVALKGTSFTLGQAKLLKRYAETAIIFFDSDAAGDNATARGIEIAQNTGLNVKIARLSSKYKDPDEAAKDSIDIIYKAIDDAVPAYDFFFSYILHKYDKNEGYGKKKIIEFLKPKIANINDSILREHYTKKLSELLDISENLIETKYQLKETPDNITDKNSKNIDTNKNIDPLFLALIRAEKQLFVKYYKTIKNRKLLDENLINELNIYNNSFISTQISKAEYIDKQSTKLINKTNLVTEIPGLADNTDEGITIFIERTISSRYSKILDKEIRNITIQRGQYDPKKDADILDKLEKKATILKQRKDRLDKKQFHTTT